MTFFNLTRVRDKEQLKSSDIYKVREIPSKKTVYSAKKPNEKISDKLVFYHQIQRPRRPDEQKPSELSNHPTSRHNSIIVGHDIQHESFDRKAPQKNIYSHRQLAEMLSDSSRLKNTQVTQKNLPYIIQSINKSAHKYSHINHASNNSSFREEGGPRDYDQSRAEDSRRMRGSINYEEITPHKPSTSFNRDLEYAPKHRRGFSMGQAPVFEKPIEVINKSMSKQERSIEKPHVMMPQHIENQIKQSILNHQLLQHHASKDVPPNTPQQTVEKVKEPVVEAEDYYAQFFHTNKLTFDFERLVLSQQQKNQMNPMNSPGTVVKKPSHHRTSSAGEDPSTINQLRGSFRWQNKRGSAGDQPMLERNNSDLIELISLSDYKVEYFKSPQEYTPEGALAMLEKKQSSKKA